MPWVSLAPNEMTAMSTGVLEQVEAAITGEAGRAFAILPDLEAAVAAQPIVEPGPDAVAEAVAEHADLDRAVLRHRRRKPRRRRIEGPPVERSGGRRRGQGRDARLRLAAGLGAAEEGGSDGRADREADEQHQGAVEEEDQPVQRAHVRPPFRHLGAADDPHPLPTNMVDKNMALSQ
jgi:hypothetical protein